MTAPRTVVPFDELLEAAWTGAFRSACRLTGGDETEAQDLRQDAALRAFRGFRTFRSGSNFGAWFRQIMLNCHRDSYRRRLRRPLAYAGDAAALDVLARGQPVQDQEAREIGRLTAQRIRAALKRLPEPFRDTARLRYVEDLSYQEVAATLACPLGTIRSRLNRARRMLRDALHWREL